MKIRYLSDEDKQTLYVLRHTTEPEMIAQILEQALRNQPTMHAIWEWRKWLFQLDEEVLRTRPILTSGLMLIYILQGQLQNARSLLEQIQEHEVHYRQGKLLMPGSEKTERERIMLQLKESGIFPDKHMNLTANRPSILNGMWDLTPYVNFSDMGKEQLLNQLELIFDDEAASIYHVAKAESLYYQDKCYEALVAVISMMHFFKERHEMQFLFVALTLEVFIMVQNGQAPSTVPMMENVRKQMKSAGAEEYLPNIDALDAWAAMYDGDYTRVTKWMREGAPDEYGKFCMLDLFRYMVKMRVYLIQGKYLAITDLCFKLQPLLEAGKRYMDLCELHMIWAMSDYAAGREEEAFFHLKEALKLSEEYRYDRLLADEGSRMYEVMKAYKAKNSLSKYAKDVLKMAQKSAMLFPRYLKSQLPDRPALTDAELYILRLLREEYTNAQIAEELGIAVETAKKHCKHIIAKLQVKNRYQAVSKAIEYGILEPK